MKSLGRTYARSGAAGCHTAGCRILVFGLTGLSMLGLLVSSAAGQLNRRGISSRGVNPVGARTSNLRSPIISNSARGAYNAGFGAAARGPYGFNYAPRVGGYYMDYANPYYGGDYGAQAESGLQGEGVAAGEASSAGSRPNIRPRLDITARDAMNSSTELKSIGQSVQQLVAKCPQRPFTPAWYAAHPKAPPMTVTGGSAWQRHDWEAVSQLAGVNASPFRYDFKPDSIGMIYVYRDEVQGARAVDMRRQAIELASSADALSNDGKPLSLGVFAAVSPVDEPVRSLVYLAMSPSGVVTGQQYDFANDSVKPIRGAVDRATQRVAWQAGNDYSEAGLKNLSEDVSRSLLFRADGWTQPWILMRVSDK